MNRTKYVLLYRIILYDRQNDHLLVDYAPIEEHYQVWLAIRQYLIDQSFCAMKKYV